MSQPANELDGSGDDAEKIRKAVDPVMCYAQSVLGGSDAATAFNDFAEAWVAETATLRDALHELADKVRLAKGAYAGSDELVKMETNSVQVGGDSLTTMPAPSGDSHLTNMPTYADRPSALSEY
ncbi:hypothetical protein OG292_34950 [Streptomyces sp. NBC_01511]|uniref:hypothetical protein n=1 Tax=Streptomyces sp. NBC_01511 TaxID=2903889 RepID=UPI00386637F7